MIKPLRGLGFKYFNCILNLGNTGQIIGLNFSILLFALFLMTVLTLKKSNVIYRKSRDLNSKLFFGPFLALACNGFIPICISIELNNEHQVSTLWGEKSANFCTRILQAYVFVWFPISMLYVIAS